MAAPSLQPGRVLGRYRLVEQIGSGGMGVVYRASDERLGRDVAIKVLLPGSIRSAVARHRVRNEALALSRISHPNIETIFEFDSQDECDYLVVELIPGASLDELLSRGPVPHVLAVSLTIQLLRGLAAAHDKGIIHRDLKPSNLRLTPESFLKVLDFGLAHLGDTDHEAKNLTTETHAHIFSGTLPYMAPEQLRGAPLDPRSDIFAVGLILYQMCTTQLPFSEKGPLLIDAILNRPIPAPRKLNKGIDPRLEEVILKAIQKDPARRYQSAREMLQDLEGLDSRVWPRRKRLIPEMVASFSVIAILLLVTFFAGSLTKLTKRFLGAKPPAPIESLAVLPLADLSNDSTQAYFADGLTDMLITDLGQIGALRVISRTSVMQYKTKPKSMKQIADELGVDAVIEGSVLRSASHVRITARLIQARTDTQIWSQIYEQDLDKIPELQSALAQAIANEVRVKLTPEEHARIAATHGVSPEVLDVYLKGRYAWENRSEDGLQRSIEYFRQAIQQDPTYALAYAGLADSYATLGNNRFLPPDQAFSNAKVAARKALALDENLAEAHASLAFSEWNYDFNWQHIEQEYKRAIELNPGYATAYHWYSGLLSGQGRHSEAIAAIEKARELDPLSPRINANVGFILYFARKYDDAIRELQKAQEMAPGSGAVDLYLGMAYLEKGAYRQAIASLQKAAEAPDNPASSTLDLAYALARAGEANRARDILSHELGNKRKDYVPALWVARLYTALGEKDKAFAWLQKAYEERSPQMAFIEVDPRLDPLRSDPRFAALLRRMNLGI